MSPRGVRDDAHAGPDPKYSWYLSYPHLLEAQLNENLANVPDSIDGHDLPIANARVIIAPHAGYKWSGPCAAWAYKCLDLRDAKRVFVLGPSHTYPFMGCAVTTYAKCATPFGHLTVDAAVIAELRQTNMFSKIPRINDVEEHSLEMHFPYLWKRLSETHDGDTGKFPHIVPILVGTNGRAAEKQYGEILLPYLEDPENAFIVSSDFCHWGPNFQYQVYYSLEAARLQREEEARQRREEARKKREQGTDAPVEEPEVAEPKPLEPILVSCTVLKPEMPPEEEYRKNKPPPTNPVEESILKMDELAIAAVEAGVHDHFLDNLRETKNTVCGRHPIGVMMAAMEALNETRETEGPSRFKKVRYERSKDVRKLDDNSVGYASFYAIIPSDEGRLDGRGQGQ